MLVVMETTRRQVVYEGRVQGVGFRATTHAIATGFSVTGFVENLDDGTVRVVALGEPSEVDRFLAAIDREFAEKVRGRSISELPPDSSEPSGFAIRY